MVGDLDADRLGYEGVDFAADLARTRDRRLDTLGMMIGEDMIAFGERPSPLRYESMLSSFENYLRVCEDLGH